MTIQLPFKLTHKHPNFITSRTCMSTKFPYLTYSCTPNFLTYSYVHRISLPYILVCTPNFLTLSTRIYTKFPYLTLHTRMCIKFCYLMYPYVHHNCVTLCTLMYA